MATEQKSAYTHEKASAAHTAEQTARVATEGLKHEGKRILEQEKGSAASEVHRLGAALHRAADDLHQSGSVLGDWASNTADAVERASGYLANHETGEVVKTFNDYAKRHPGFVIGGLFLAGIGASRFLRASSGHKQHAGGWESEAYPSSEGVK